MIQEVFLRLGAAILAVVLLVQSTYLQAYRCPELWFTTWRKVKISSIQFKRELVELKGWRFLVRYMHQGDLQPTGFFTRYSTPPQKDIFDYWQSVSQFIPRRLTQLFIGKPYNFDFIGGFRSWTLDPLVHVGTKKYFGERMEPSIFLALPVDLAIFSVALGTTYSLYADRRYRQIAEDIEARKDEWDYYKTDFRYKFIRLQLAEGKITEKQAREWAAVMSDDYQGFMELLKLSNMDLANPEVQDVLLAMPQFAEISLAISGGMKIDEGFAAKENFSSQITPEQVQELVEQKIFMFLMFDVAYEVVSKKLQAGGTLSELAKKISESSYTKALLHLRSQGKLNDAQLIYHIQEDIYFEMQFHKWNALHVVKLKPDQGGKFDGRKPLTLQDVRKSNLKAIQLGYP